MAGRGTNSALREIQTLFSLGCVGDRADGELLDWFNTHHTAAEAAFEELVARHGAMVFDVCRRVLNNRQDVEDAFQATFLVLIRRAGSIRNPAALGGWLHRVALRVALRAKKAAGRRRETEEETVGTGIWEQFADGAEQAEVRAAVHEELDRIPASYRVALVACYLEGLTHEQAASRLHLPVGTVRSRLARGRDRLRDRLVRRGLAPQTLDQPTQPMPAGLKKTTAQSMFFYVAGRAGAGSVPASVAALAERVIHAMKLRSLRIVAAMTLTVGAIAGVLPILSMQLSHQAKAAAPEQKAAVDASKSLVGIVRDAEGRPVACATVVAGAFTTNANHQILTTGADGRFEFHPTKETERLGYVLAYKEGLAPASKFRLGGEKPPAPAEVELTLLSSEPFVGVVQDQDGRPIAGAKVRIRYMLGKGGQYDHNPILENVLKDTPLDALFHATTDKQGGFHFVAVPSPQRVQLTVTADGMADFSTEVPGNRDAGFISSTATAPARLVMEASARVLGRIVTKLPGVSVAGLKVAMQSTNGSAHFWREVNTDAEGRFAMHGLPEGGGNIFLTGHPNDGPWTYVAIDNLALHPGKTSEVTIELIEGVLVEGKIVEAGTSKPRPGAFVGMYGPARPQSGAAIMSAKPDNKGIYHFRLPPGKTYIYTSDSGVNVVIPDGVKTFTVPTIETKKAEPPAAAVKKPETVALSGIVCDVSDRPIAGATVVGAIVAKDKKLVDRQIATTTADGRFSLNIPKLIDPEKSTRVYAFKQGLAPAKANPIEIIAPGDLKLTLPRPRPFACLVHSIVLFENDAVLPVVGADARIQSIRTPLVEGSGMTVVEIDWPVIEGTPLESVFRTKSDAKGLLTFPSIPARSEVNLTVTAPGLSVHHTTDFALPGATGRWPAGFNAGFLNGNTDWPAKIYLEKEGKGSILKE